MRALVAALTAVLVASCSAHTEVVPIGGAQSTVQRPWGTVRTFPELEKAQIPTMDELEFARHMITHHEQAVELSRLVLAHGDAVDERVAAAARFIAQDQGAEITALQGWLDSWARTPEVLPHGSHDVAHAGATHPSTPMPGMIDADEIDRLGGMAPAEALSEFARLMISHHEGAVAMSKDFLTDGRNDFVVAVGRHIVREQRLEITYLSRLAADLRLSTAPAG